MAAGNKRDGQKKLLVSAADDRLLFAAVFPQNSSWLVALAVCLACSAGVGRAEEPQAQVAVQAAGPTAFWSGNKTNVELTVFAPPGQPIQLSAGVFQVSAKLAAPVPQRNGIDLPPQEGIARRIAFPIELPAVERKTSFILRFNGAIGVGAPAPAGIVHILLYPTALLDPLRQMSSQPDLSLFAVGSPGPVLDFLRAFKIPVEEIGATLIESFDRRGIVLCQGGADTVLPRSLRSGQALVVIETPEKPSAQRVLMTPLGQGVLARVTLPGLGDLANSPQEQEVFQEIIQKTVNLLYP